MPKEIERKWLLRDLPESRHLGLSSHIKQGYFASLRYRKVSYLWKAQKHYCITQKGPGTLVREENEQEVPDWIVESTLVHGNIPTIEKRRYPIEERDQMMVDVDALRYDSLLTVDRYSGNLAGLIIMEREFNLEDLARVYILPHFIEPLIIKEVTEDPRYSNYNLAQTQRIPIQI